MLCSFPTYKRSGSKALGQRRPDHLARRSLYGTMVHRAIMTMPISLPKPKRATLACVSFWAGVLGLFDDLDPVHQRPRPHPPRW